MLVDHIEGGEQALAALAVEAADGLAQALDGLDEVVALGRRCVVLASSSVSSSSARRFTGAEALAVALRL